MRRAEHGFTLVETLVALALLGLLSLLLYDGLHFGLRAWERADAHDDAGEEVRAVRALIRHQLERAVPLLLASDSDRPSVAFDGDGTGMAFFSPALQAVSSGGYARVSLEARQHDGQWALTLSAAPELAWPDAAQPRPEMLLDGLQRVSFRYLGGDGESGPSRWLEQWRHRSALPRLVRIDAEFPPGDRRRWPELVVATRVTAEADDACIVAPRDCRGR